ncbi:MAG: WYL domain-containing protein [bacterium]|nr:WYL domain-containing protein [bacterium]
MRRQKNTSLKDLVEFLETHDLAKSERTISRYIEQMRHEFGLDIKYDNGEKGYSFQHSDEREVDVFLNFMQLAQSAGIELGGIKNRQALSQLVQFDYNQRLRGIEHLKDLLFAIQNRRYLKFNHVNFHTEKTSAYWIKPILLKQYLYRWYVIGAMDDDSYRTFGFDRLTDLEVDIKTFAAKNNKEVRKNFEQIIGLNYSNHKMQTVRLQLTPLQSKYLITAPLHASQYVELETSKSVVFVLNLIPNYELIQKILMMGNQVKVLAPTSLRNEVKNHLKSALDLYKK